MRHTQICQGTLRIGLLTIITGVGILLGMALQKVEWVHENILSLPILTEG